MRAIDRLDIGCERGVAVEEVKRTTTRDYADLIRVTITSGEQEVSVVGTVIGNQNRPHLLEVWGQRFQVQLEKYITLFRYKDQPGMLGRVGTVFGEHGVNIGSSIVGRQPQAADPTAEPLAAMVISSDVAVPRDVVDEIASGDGFVAGVTVSL